MKGNIAGGAHGALKKRLMALALGAGALSALTGAAHFVAWLSGFMAERGVSTITMKTNASLCLLLSGVALVLLLPESIGEARRWTGRICAALVLLIGGLTLSEHLIGWDVGIDQLLAQEPPGAKGVFHPNRMGPPASLNFTLIGAALLLLSRRRGRGEWALQWLALGVCLIALLGVLGHLYDVRGLYALERLTAIAWPTAAALLLLGVGLLCARPGEGVMAQVSADDPGGVTIRRLLLPALLLPVGLGCLQLMAERHELFDPAMGTALLVLGFVAIFSILVYHTGSRQSGFAAAERRAHEALHEKEERFRLAAQAANDAIWDWDLETNHITWNEAVSVFGYPEASAGTSIDWWEERIHPEERERVTAGLHQVIESGTRWQDEYRFLRADGSYAYILDRGAVLRRPDGSATRMIGAMLDLTSRLEAEAALRSAKEAAEAGNRAKDRFLLTMSHELRTPLTVIMGMQELALGEGEAQPPLRRYLEAAQKSSHMLLALVSDLLEISRIEQGEALLQEAVFDLHRCVKDTVGPFLAQARDKGLHLSLQMEAGVPLKVRGDCERLTQVLEKLLDNAIRFTEGGDVEVRVLPGKESGGRREVHIVVRDTGIGIPEEALERIFDKFTQADESLTRRFGGAGLGLAISRALVETMGGRIEVQSTAGEGSLFSCIIPFAEARMKDE